MFFSVDMLTAADDSGGVLSLDNPVLSIVVLK